MKETEFEIILTILGVIIMVSGLMGMGKRYRKQEEHIKFLEQSLNEQIQEKQVYMNILEGRNE